MTLADLDAYEVVIREPIVGNYRDYTLMGTSPESSGGLTSIQMLKMLERFPLGDASQGFGFGTTKTLHVMMEAMRLAYADRAIYMGDGDPPNGVPVPTVGLLADGYVQLRSEMIDEDSRMSTPSAGDPWLYNIASLPGKVMLAALSPPEVEEGGHTTHFSVVDRWGNVVSTTSTIEAGWGTGIMVPGYGFLLNNELTDFNSTPQTPPGANDVAPFKRPRSSMAPSILFKDGKPIAAYGSPGGPRIITTVLQTTLNLVDHGMTIQEAIDAPRITVYSSSGYSRYHEAGFSPDVLQELKDLGHYVRSYTRAIGSVQAVVIDHQTGKQYGGADSRREGVVIGLPRPRKNLAGIIDDLSDLPPSGDNKTERRIENAIKHIEHSLNPKSWESDPTLTKKGKKVFDELKKAVKELKKIHEPTILDINESIVDISNSLAQTVIQEAIATGGRQKEIDKALKEIDKAQKELDHTKRDGTPDPKYDKAIDHNKKAWEHAHKAMN